MMKYDLSGRTATGIWASENVRDGLRRERKPYRFDRDEHRVPPFAASV
jgi:hypothetical protein